MTRIPSLRPKDVIRALCRAGFFVHHQTGSHIQLRHTHQRHLRVTIPNHGRFALPSFVIASILKQADLPRDIFLDLI